jgi:hypothetical protein
MAQELVLEFGGKTFDSVSEGMQHFLADFITVWEGEAKVVGAAIKDYLDVVARALVARHSGAWPGGTTATTLSSRSGESMKTVLKSVDVQGTTWSTLQGSIGGKATLLIHEYGGVINSKGKMLTIPLPAALNADGTQIKASARDWDNTFIARTKGGNLLIFQRRGASVVPLYVLRDSVTIRPRLGMRDELQAHIPYFVDRTVDRIVADVLQRSGA